MEVFIFSVMGYIIYIFSPGVDGDSASVVKLDAELLKTEVMGVWPPAHAHKEDVSLHLLSLASAPPWRPSKDLHSSF